MIEVSSLTKTFGPFTAISNVSLSVRDGGVLGVMGVNGAGKSTLLDCMCGAKAPSAGRITLDGERIDGLPPHAISRAGVGRTFQVPRTFQGLTSLENLLVVPAAGRSAAQMKERAAELLAYVRLDHVADNYADELSGGQQKLLEFARVLMANSRTILLDEPFAGMHPDLCRLFTSRVEEIVREGACLILVTHDPETLYRLSDTLIVLHQGQVIAQGPPDTVRRDPVVIEAYLGA